jgi:hypothetical protein
MKQKSQSSSSPAPSVIYLKHANLADMLKVILLAAESPLGIAVMLYHIKYKDKDILFTASGDYNFVDKIGEDTKSLYIPVLELEKSTFNFPL